MGFRFYFSKHIQIIINYYPMRRSHLIRSTTALLVGCYLVFTACQANTIEQKEPVSIVPSQEPTEKELFYRIREAKGSEQPVLLVLLHGYGANEDDLFSMAGFFPENYMVVTPQAPMNIGQKRYQWYTIERNENNGFEGKQQDLSTSISSVKTLVENIQKKYGVTAERTFIAGFSQGANMSYQLGLNHPELMKGIGAWSGTIFDSLKEKLEQTKAGNLQIFIAHGDQDAIIPYVEAEQSKTWLDKKGYQSSLHTYKGMAHSVSKEELEDFLNFIQKNT